MLFWINTETINSLMFIIFFIYGTNIFLSYMIDIFNKVIKKSNKDSELKFSTTEDCNTSSSRYCSSSSSSCKKSSSIFETDNCFDSNPDPKCSSSYSPIHIRVTDPLDFDSLHITDTCNHKLDDNFSSSDIDVLHTSDVSCVFKNGNTFMTIQHEKYDNILNCLNNLDSSDICEKTDKIKKLLKYNINR